MQYGTFVQYTFKYTKNDDEERKRHNTLFFPQYRIRGKQGWKMPIKLQDLIHCAGLFVI